MTTSDAVAREVSYLRATGDGPPALLAPSGPWQIIQAYWPRTPNTRQTGIYLLRPTVLETRFSNQRKLDSYEFRGRLWWPIGSTSATGSWEDEQAALDNAVDLLIQRIRGLPFDHTHLGNFLSVAEAPDPGRITVRFEDPAQTAVLNPAVLLAEITYSADDQDYFG